MYIGVNNGNGIVLNGFNTLLNQFNIGQSVIKKECLEIFECIVDKFCTSVDIHN